MIIRLLKCQPNWSFSLSSIFPELQILSVCRQKSKSIEVKWGLSDIPALILSIKSSKTLLKLFFGQKAIIESKENMEFTQNRALTAKSILNIEFLCEYFAEIIVDVNQNKLVKQFTEQS